MRRKLKHYGAQLRSNQPIDVDLGINEKFLIELAKDGRCFFAKYAAGIPSKVDACKICPIKHKFIDSPCTPRDAQIKAGELLLYLQAEWAFEEAIK